MVSSKESLAAKLKKEYFRLVKKSLEVQREGDIRAFAGIAMKKEQVAQKLQALHRNR